MSINNLNDGKFVKVFTKAQFRDIMQMKGGLDMKKLIALTLILCSVIFSFSSCDRVISMTEYGGRYSSFCNISGVSIELYRYTEEGIYATIVNDTSRSIQLKPMYKISGKSDSVIDELDYTESKLTVPSLSERTLFFPVDIETFTKNGKHILDTSVYFSDDTEEDSHIFSLTLSFNVKKISPNKEYTVSFDELFIELPKNKYKPGETVEFTYPMVHDANVLVFMNGRYLKEPSFIMPAEGVRLNVQMVGARNRPEHMVELETAYLIDNGGYAASVKEIYGEYASGAIVASFIPQGDVKPKRYQETVEGYIFKYDKEYIKVLYKEKLLTLRFAYENGYLSEEEITEIAEKYQCQS